jgi:actin-related protein
MANLSVVFDIGQFSTKVGFGGENEPRVTFFSVAGIPKYKSIETGVQKQIFVGNEVVDSIGLYKISYPIEKGEIADWEMFQALIDYAFYQLRIDPSTVNILFAMSPFLSDESKIRIIKLFFEKYQAMAFYPVRSALLTMYSGGFDTGLVVDIGASNVRITPIFESYVLNHAIQYLPIGGVVLDNFLRTRLSRVGIQTESSVQRELIRALKEQACFVSLNLDDDLKNVKQYYESYTMPDGSKFAIDEDRFMVPELFFKPGMFNIDCDPLHVAILNSIELCDIDIRRKLLDKIILIGGSSLFPQLDTRLEQELLDELHRQGKEQQSVHIIAPEERVYANWIGGSILAMIPEFQDRWLTRASYFRDGIPQNFIKLE